MYVADPDILFRHKINNMSVSISSDLQLVSNNKSTVTRNKTIPMKAEVKKL